MLCSETDGQGDMVLACKLGQAVMCLDIQSPVDFVVNSPPWHGPRHYHDTARLKQSEVFLHCGTPLQRGRVLPSVQ